MLYGAYGYTGALLTEEALNRGHRPVLAGRNKTRLQRLAQRYDLEILSLNLEDEKTLKKAVAQFDLVFHAAGPFVHTAKPMLKACLAGKTHYLDITGEIPVLEHIKSLDQQASEVGVVLISGAGFDVVPSDCLASYLTQRLPEAIDLELAFATPGKFSPGTAKTAIEGLPKGGMVRRDAQYLPFPLGHGHRRILFSDGRARSVMPIPWGDLATGYRTTGIPNITTYMAISHRQQTYLSRLAPAGQKLMSPKIIRHLAQRLAALTIHGPDEDLRQSGHSFLWGQVSDANGATVQAWLETLEPYQLTAVAGVRCVEKVLDGSLTGALTPSQAFGVDFALELGDTTRHDKITA
jgi:short subunit dehydrogenase-like uncharacterized protein